MHYEKETQNLFELMPTITEVFFKNFEIDNPLFDEFKLNATHIKTLMIIRFNPNSPMNLISQKVDLEKGSFTPVANKLFSIGFIEKIPCEKDKRKSFLRLTPKGMEFTDEFREKHLVHISSKLDNLSQIEQDLFQSSLQMLLALSKKISES